MKVYISIDQSAISRFHRSITTSNSYRTSIVTCHGRGPRPLMLRPLGDQRNIYPTLFRISNKIIKETHRSDALNYNQLLEAEICGSRDEDGLLGAGLFGHMNCGPEQQH